MPRALLALICLVLAAQSAWPQTLAPGKPAGTRAAQHISQRGLFIGASLVAVALVFGLPSSSPTTAASPATTN